MPNLPSHRFFYVIIFCGGSSSSKRLLKFLVSKLLLKGETAPFKATFCLTISLHGQRATGKIQRNNGAPGYFLLNDFFA